MTSVKIYTTPTCPWCERTKQFLIQKKIPFQEFDVTEDLKAQKEMIEKSGQMSVPVLEIDDKLIIGFNPRAIEEATTHVKRDPKLTAAKMTKKKPKKAPKPKKESLVKAQGNKPMRRW